MTFEERARALVAQMTLPEKMSQLRYDAPAIPRLNVPAYNWWNECLHGAARAGTATVFPQAIAMAAAFNAPLLEEVATAISDEVRAKYNRYKTFGETEIYQGLTCWSPNINIFRDPRWGRGHETYGEDPFLTGRLGAAFVRGLQGDDPKYRKVDATLKHFCAHSGPESIRHGFDAVVSEEDLQSTYLPAFRYCIETSDPSAVMGAYNSLNGEPCCGSVKVIEELLRDELGFTGYVVSDCGAVRDIDQYHHKTASPAESAALAVNSGCDLNCGSAYTWLQAAYEQGLVSEEAITRSAERLFAARFRLGMFDDDCPYDALGIDVVCSPAHRALNREIARQGIVLLKNDGLLPLKGGERIAVIGPNADEMSVLLGNYNGIPDQYTTLLRGIQEASAGRVLYAKGCHHYDPKVPERAQFPLREAILAARDSDVVILCMGLTPQMEGEEGDAYNGCNGGDKFDLELPVPQKELFEAVLAEGKPVIFVNVSGSAINLCRQDETCAAVVQCFYPGAEGGGALADILFGKANPSGRLPVTFYRSADDLPDFADYSMKGRTYRFFEGKPLYPFGHGLSYTDFIEEQLDGNRVRVANAGSMDGWHTVLRFAPHLAGFQKVFLKAGESAVLSFEP
ncbi:MAG: glycoside hydrolase family 3 protein [Oscillospiraceae bacterium]|jgi:beta-glucosidase|nr:glycoside hydrolase family 3 protein [Oscillospiraceae bacterium]